MPNAKKTRIPRAQRAPRIVLCKSKNETIVEYALRGAVQLLGVATYRTHGELPAELQRELPLPAQIARLLESID